MTDFRFWVPIEKSGVKETSGKRYVYGVASSEAVDLDAEIVGKEAIQKSLDYFLRHGRIDYDHKSKIDPKFIIGEPVAASFDGKNQFHIKGLLYKGVEVADNLWKQFRAGNTRMGWSIGGKIINRTLQFNKSLRKMVPRVTEAIINHVAITPHPKNTGTWATITPYGEFVKSLATAADPSIGRVINLGGKDFIIAEREELAKAIAAGYDAAYATGGGALRAQDLEGHVKVFKDFITSKNFSKDPDAVRHFFTEKGIGDDLAKAFSRYIGENYQRIKDLRSKS